LASRGIISLLGEPLLRGVNYLGIKIKFAPKLLVHVTHPYSLSIFGNELETHKTLLYINIDWFIWPVAIQMVALSLVVHITVLLTCSQIPLQAYAPPPIRQRHTDGGHVKLSSTWHTQMGTNRLYQATSGTPWGLRPPASFQKQKVWKEVYQWQMQCLTSRQCC